MVLFFTPRGAETTGHVIYMGEDKHENEELIAHGLPIDVWLHVNGMSSAHVYIRLSRGQTIADITKEELEDCCQLVKAHSIAGHKAPTVAVVYTPWSNLRKTSDMEVGQVGFTSEKEVIRTGNISRNNEALNRLMRTRKELFPNLATVRADWDAEERAIRKEAERIRKKEDATLERERRKEAEERSYDRLMDSERMVTNAEVGQRYETVEDAEEDFM